MSLNRPKNPARRAVLVPTVVALGAAAAFGIRTRAVSEQNTPPVQPSTQVLSMQNAFESVADKLRPAVVYIRSRQKIAAASMFRQGANEGDGNDFSFPFPSYPGMQGGPGMRRRTIPQLPQYPQYAEASGSGVIVRQDGYILTNDHVVAGSDKVTVKLQDGREFVGQVKRDFKSDLALIKIDAKDLPTAELGDSDKTKIGQWAIAFGSPLGLSDTMTVGIVSALHREQAIGSGSDGRFYSSLLQTDASINPGNSGGPLVDVYGRVVGINVAIDSPVGYNVGIGFAIPSNTARYVMDQLIQKGAITRGFLGLRPTTPSYAEKQRYGITEGALVSGVDDGTPAAKAGFQVEDVIVRFNGQAGKDDVSLRDMVSQTSPDTSVPVTIKRDGREVTLNVTLGTASEPKEAAAVTPVVSAERGKLGISVADANNSQVRQQLQMTGPETSGAAVAEVLPGSPASMAGIEPGDIILRLDGKKIDTAQQLTDVAHGLKGGSAVTAVVRRGNHTILAEIALE